jgi:hypothetical protein
MVYHSIFFTSINQHMFKNKVFQTMLFSRYVQKASHCYKIFVLGVEFQILQKYHRIQNKFFYIL